MEQKGNTQIVNKNAISNEINHIVINSAIKNIQIQNADKKSNACSLNQNIESMNINGELVQQTLNIDDQLKSLFKWRIIIASLALIQFSILFSLILIQYISSKIELSTLILILILLILLHTVLLAALCTIDPDSNQQASPQAKVGTQAADRAGSIEMPTLPKINQYVRQINYEKTKKVQYPNVQMRQQQCTKQIMKKEGDRTLKEIKEFQFYNISFTTRRKFIIVSKILQAILQITIPTLFLFLFGSDDNTHFHIVIIVLFAVNCMLSIGSCILISIFLKNINLRKIKKQQSRKVVQEQQQPKTKISIDQAIQQKICETNNTIEVKIVKQPKQQARQALQQTKQAEKEGGVASMLKIQQDKEFEKMSKSLIKRSVLKNKIKKPSLHHIVEEQGMERRKVEINSKKIQYFQYSEISASHSIGEEQDSKKNKIANKSKYHLQKLASQHQKMEYQQKLLQNKILEREKRAKSEACVTKKNEEVDDQIRPDYFC